MQLYPLPVKLLWLLLPAVAVALTPITPGSTPVGTGELDLLIPQNLSSISVGRMAYCKHDDDPYRFVSSLNNTFPITPSIPESFLTSAGIALNESSYPFDCFLELPGGIFVFEVRRIAPVWRRDSKHLTGLVLVTFR